MNILEGWNTYHFKGDILRHVSDSNHFQNNIRIIGSQDINITIQDIKFQDKSLSNIQNVLFHLDLPRYQLHDIVQKYLYTPDEAMYPTFQMKYVLAIQHVCSWRCYSNNLEDIFFGTPCTFYLSYFPVLNFDQKPCIVPWTDPTKSCFEDRQTDRPTNKSTPRCFQPKHKNLQLYLGLGYILVDCR